MRKSKVLEKLRAGEVATCFKTNFTDARIVEMIGLAGFDCVWTCYEHCGNDLAAIERQIYAAKATNMDIVVRVSKGSYSDFIRPLELDATGIMVPHLMSADEARDVAWKTKFHPMGRRPADGGNADGGFLFYPVDRYMADSNHEKFVICQIEDPEAMDQLDEIAQVEGIDMLFFGPGDFSHALGIPGQMKDERVLDAWKRTGEACRKYGKFAGTVASPGNVEQLHDWGYNFLNMSSDVGALYSYLPQMLKAFDAVR
ncbi:MAG: aldolase/citrate lyase family protein [Clostridia bacterium]